MIIKIFNSAINGPAINESGIKQINKIKIEEPCLTISM